MSVNEVKTFLAASQGLSFEEQISVAGISSDDIFSMIDYDSYFELSGKKMPENKTEIVDVLQNEDLIKKESSALYQITNLGGILFAKNLSQFKKVKRKAVRVIVYIAEKNYPMASRIISDAVEAGLIAQQIRKALQKNMRRIFHFGLDEGVFVGMIKSLKIVSPLS